MAADDKDDKLARVVRSRLRLRERFDAKMQRTPAAVDAAPQGSGSANRHGMPRLPVGQIETQKWPVLDLGSQPEIALADWQLVVDGACEQRLCLSWADFLALPQVDDTSDFHCVTTWSRFDVDWTGVRFADLAALAAPTDAATHVLCHAYDGYTTNLPLEEALKPDVLLVHRADNGPLPRDHGGPVRMITPQLYAWKGAKWISRIEFLAGDHPGFWEVRGYSNSAHPWRNDRYS
ncbi:MAG: sulfite oxidase-like oxidoreductase [Myxococcales bacterium]|nr:sulfite oxidase-like oxidoreductase [Myxococcales bacterium]